MKKIAVENAVGMVLGHDITKIVPGEFKGRAFKKDHIIQKEDIDELLKLGKEHIYVWDQSSGEIHEDEAALRIARAVIGENAEYDEPKEGKVTLQSTAKGLFKVNSELMHTINAIDDISIASLPGNFAVEEGQKMAGARIIPLMVEEEKVEEVESLCAEKGAVFTVLPYKKLKAAVIVTGNEVYRGRIEDKFTPIMQKKLAYFNADYLGRTFCPDDIEEITKTILGYKEQGADIILLTGGMSVDPDDVTPSAIRNVGARIVTYGAPVQPGNMFMMAYLDMTTLMGVPGCAMYYKTTILDAVLPRVFAGETLFKDDFVSMGEGGFCLNCEVCRYPKCFFCR
ncbi:MAG: molybdopterin-binding protein [Firmicutes bacterium]|nr:molybdopterin-binding protein [Bacillota bacterium]